MSILSTKNSNLQNNVSVPVDGKDISFETHLNTFLTLFEDMKNLNSSEVIQKYSAPMLAGWLVPKIFNMIDRFFLHRIRQRFDIPHNKWFFNALGCSVLNCFLYLLIKKCCGIKIFNVLTPNGERHVPNAHMRAALARTETIEMQHYPIGVHSSGCSSRDLEPSDVVVIESPSLTPKSIQKQK